MKNKNSIKIVISLFLLISILNIVSAQISVSPESISFNAYPGDSITKNITISTDENYAVYLSYNVQNNATPINISLNYTSPLIVEKIKTIPITFIFPADLAPQKFKINLQASTDIYQAPSSNYYIVQHTGSSIVYKNVSANQTISVNLDNQTCSTDCVIKTSTIGFFQRIINWFKGILTWIYNFFV